MIALGRLLEMLRTEAAEQQSPPATCACHRPGLGRAHECGGACAAARAFHVSLPAGAGWRCSCSCHVVRAAKALGLLFALLLAAPALAAPPAPPGPLAALAHQAAVEAAGEEIASHEPAGEAGDPLEALLLELLAEEDEETAEDESQEWAGEAIDEEDGGEAAEESGGGSWLTEGLTAAGWCAVYRGEPREDRPGCDMGVGAALPWRPGPVVFPFVIGMETAGFGVAVVLYKSPTITIAVAGGVVVPYDGRGIRLDGAAPALGATFGLGGGR